MLPKNVPLQQAPGQLLKHDILAEALALTALKVVEMIVLMILTVPRYVGICTKYVAAVFDNRHGGSLSITVAVECGCSRAVCLGMPTPHKPVTM